MWPYFWNIARNFYPISFALEECFIDSKISPCIWCSSVVSKKNQIYLKSHSYIILFCCHLSESDWFHFLFYLLGISRSTFFLLSHHKMCTVLKLFSRTCSTKITTQGLRSPSGISLQPWDTFTRWFQNHDLCHSNSELQYTHMWAFIWWFL